MQSRIVKHEIITLSNAYIEWMGFPETGIYVHGTWTEHWAYMYETWHIVYYVKGEKKIITTREHNIDRRV